MDLRQHPVLTGESHETKTKDSNFKDRQGICLLQSWLHRVWRIIPRRLAMLVRSDGGDRTQQDDPART